MAMKNWSFPSPQFEADKLNDLLVYNPWSGHRKFAYDLIAFLRPRCIVELGTHYGCSLFSFAQSVKDNQLNTQIISIDNWKGDPHAGYYGKEVYELVCNTIEKFYHNITIELVVKSFSEAALQIKKNSIDILHIDGYHSYQSTLENFDMMKPKLKIDSVVLFHDIEKNTGYGSADFWEDLKREYNYHFELKHSWGLGVLLNSKNIFESLERSTLFTKLDKYLEDYLAETNQNKVSIIENLNAIIELKKKLNHLQSTIDNKDEQISAWEKTTQDKDKYIAVVEGKLKENDQYIFELKHLIDIRDKELSELKKAVIKNAK